MAKSKKQIKLPEAPVVESPIVKQEPVATGGEKFFAPEHLRKIETSLLEIENKKLLMAVEEQNLANMNLTMEILKSRIEKQRQVVHARAVEYEAAKKIYADFKKDVFPSYGIENRETVEYDSNTGRIF